MERTADQGRRSHDKFSLFNVCLVLTISFFLYKGILYALIGSYVPMIIITVIVGLLIFSFKRSSEAFRKSTRLWSYLIILWSAVRLILSIVNQFIKTIPEGHIAGQLEVQSLLLSIAFLIAGICLWKNSKRIVT